MPQKGILSGKGKKVKVLLIAILLLGAFLRVYGLGTESFWLDEADTAQSTEFTVPQIIEKTYTDSTIFPEFWGGGAGSVPLYYVLVNYWTEIFGLSEFKLRLISALFGVISIYLIFLLGRFLFNSQTGLIAAFILAINHQQIYFSQEARMYGMLVTLTLLSVLFLLRALSDGKTIHWVVFVITNAALLYTHYFSFFILFFEGLYVLIYWQKHKKFLKQIFFSAAAIFVLYLPWIPALIKQLSYGPPLDRVIGAPPLSGLITDLFQIMIQFNSWISPDLSNRIALRTMNFFGLTNSGWLLIISVVMLALLLGSAFIFGLIYLKNRKICTSSLKDHKVIFLLLWLLIPVLIPFLISVFSPKNAIFSDIRYVLFASPAYYLIASLGISRIKKQKTIFLALLALFSLIPLYSYYANFDTQQWREASDYLEINRSPDEYLFIQKANNILPLQYYYPNMANVIAIDSINQFTPQLENKQSFWLVLSLEKYTDPKGLVKTHADAHYTLTEKNEYNGIKIFHYIQTKDVLITAQNN
jgi:uncharacterized membrane protein